MTISESGPGTDSASRAREARRAPSVGAVTTTNRSNLSFKIAYAVRHPGRVLPYARRRGRDI
jgi:hypothetical protein